MYFKNISCYCSCRRNVPQGEIYWEQSMHQEEMIMVKDKADSQQRNTSSSSEVSSMPAYMHTTIQTPHRGFSFHVQQ